MLLSAFGFTLVFGFLASTPYATTSDYDEIITDATVSMNQEKTWTPLTTQTISLMRSYNARYSGTEFEKNNFERKGPKRKVRKVKKRRKSEKIRKGQPDISKHVSSLVEASKEMIERSSFDDLPRNLIKAYKRNGYEKVNKEDESVEGVLKNFDLTEPNSASYFVSGYVEATTLEDFNGEIGFSESDGRTKNVLIQDDSNDSSITVNQIDNESSSTTDGSNLNDQDENIESEIRQTAENQTYRFKGHSDNIVFGSSIDIEQQNDSGNVDQNVQELDKRLENPAENLSEAGSYSVSNQRKNSKVAVFDDITAKVEELTKTNKTGDYELTAFITNELDYKNADSSRLGSGVGPVLPYVNNFKNHKYEKITGNDREKHIENETTGTEERMYFNFFKDAFIPLIGSVFKELVDIEEVEKGEKISNDTELKLLVHSGGNASLKNFVVQTDSAKIDDVRVVDDDVKALYNKISDVKHSKKDSKFSDNFIQKKTFLSARNYDKHAYNYGGHYVKHHGKHEFTELVIIFLALIPICLVLGASAAFALASVTTNNSNNNNNNNQQQQQQQAATAVVSGSSVVPSILPYFLINGTVFTIVGRSLGSESEIVIARSNDDGTYLLTETNGSPDEPLEVNFEQFESARSLKAEVERRRSRRVRRRKGKK